VFELGVISDEISQDLERALEVAADYDVRAVELRGVWDQNIVEMAREDAQRARDLIRERGFRVCSIASPFYKCALPGAEGSGGGAMHLAAERALGEQMEVLRRAAEMAHLFETDLIRGFAFWRQEGGLTPALRQQVIDAFAEPVALMEREGLVLGLENEHACVLGTGEEVASVVGAIDSPHLRVIWDPGNAFFVNETPFPDGYRAVKPYLVHVHLKDAKRNAEGKPTWTVMGGGEIDYAGQFKALADDGYSGVLSLESHYKSSDGSTEQGSRMCFEGIRRLLQEAGVA
jgi:sugar phosphate isomerase/epimerase